tara:strand:- start:29 stop:535 length:507 start_codon:yes stop_codon:yes gene_type:complete
MSNKYVGAGKIFFDGFTKVFKGPQHKGVVATIGGVKPKAILSEATKKFKQKIKAIDKGLKKGIEDFKSENPNRNVTDDQIKKIKKDKKEEMVQKETKAFLREKKRKGGRIGYKKGTGRSGVPAMDIKSTPTKKLSEKQKKIAMLAGDPRRIDKPDFAKLRSKNKKKVI